ncbi:hypothetical protein OXPF_42900 [Oxobacter pfennigii]|uniref:Uncharacterized protein n=1 Tax=Oxobacter pfennigii TaxID=36849 RepID=A0A0P8W4R8_9CLOT|nr:hypothetical protein [Oxobacter pfennigii]KPU42505.1 hypothetical protein OXPF_42900 [Oxobacter pfennigii]
MEDKKITEMLEELKNDESWEEDSAVREAAVKAFERVLTNM